MNIYCKGCHREFPIESFPHRCPECGDLFGLTKGLVYSPEKITSELPGIWKFRATFSLPEKAPVISLGEGNTPLIWSEFRSRRIGFKLESLNPTGSFKDRGAAVLISWLLAAGKSRAVEDSSGNAGAAFAAYASRGDIQGKVFVPSYASGPKRHQIESYGAEVVAVPGPRSNAAAAVLESVKEGSVYASHAYLPHGTAGIATIAYELLQQSPQAPGTILAPVGHGSLLLGIYLGFKALHDAGLIAHLPILVGLQAGEVAPLWKAYSENKMTPVKVREGKTIAEGVSIATPYHGEEVLKSVKESGGFFMKVNEQEIFEGQKQLAQRGVYVEPTSALIWSGLEQLPDQVPEPIICLVTGHGLKSDIPVA
jgi:threonine synthase